MSDVNQLGIFKLLIPVKPAEQAHMNVVSLSGVHTASGSTVLQGSGSHAAQVATNYSQ